MDQHFSPVAGATDQDGAFLLELLPGKGYIAQNDKRRAPSSFDSDSFETAGCQPTMA